MPTAIVSELEKYLDEDLDTQGFHAGQFGGHSREEEEERYVQGKELISVKPRMYLTGVPVAIISRHVDKLKIARRLPTVEQGIAGLFRDSWVYVAMGASHYTNPMASKRSERQISYRHTIRAAQILLEVNPKHSIPRSVLGHMLDQNIDMQTDQGGWKQCDKEFTDEDLWGTTYAIGFLSLCLERARHLSIKDNAKKIIAEKLDKSIDWMQGQWDIDNWRYGDVPAEENSPIMFCEIASALFMRKSDLGCQVLSKFRSFLDPMGNPSQDYLKLLRIVGRFGASIRLAYSFFLGNDSCPGSTEIAANLKRFAIESKGSGYNCVEASFLLDMILSEQKNPNQVAGGVLAPSPHTT